MAQERQVFNADKQIDGTGLFCPMPVVNIERVETDRDRGVHRFLVRKTR